MLCSKTDGAQYLTMKLTNPGQKGAKHVKVRSTMGGIVRHHCRPAEHWMCDRYRPAMPKHVAKPNHTSSVVGLMIASLKTLTKSSTSIQIQYISRFQTVNEKSSFGNPKQVGLNLVL